MPSVGIPVQGVPAVALGDISDEANEPNLYRHAHTPNTHTDNTQTDR